MTIKEYKQTQRRNQEQSSVDHGSHLLPEGRPMEVCSLQMEQKKPQRRGYSKDGGTPGAEPVGAKYWKGKPKGVRVS